MTSWRWRALITWRQYSYLRRGVTVASAQADAMRDVLICQVSCQRLSSLCSVATCRSWSLASGSPVTS